MYSSSFSLKGWKSIVYYFDFPKILINDSYYTNSVFYKRFNISLFNILKTDYYVVELTDIHGYLELLLKDLYRNEYINIMKDIYSIKELNKKIVVYIIYNEFFIPSNNITFYVNKFLIKKKKMKVLGIHIRSGKFYNNFTEEYFNKTKGIYTYLSKATEIMKKHKIAYVFTISDSHKYLVEMKNHFKGKIIDVHLEGDIVHSKFSLYIQLNNNAIRIVTEFFILSKCDFIIGTRRSSFSAESCNINMKYCIFI